MTDEAELGLFMQNVYWRYSRTFLIGGILLSLAILIWDCFSWLEAHRWSALSLMDIFAHQRLTPPDPDWKFGRAVMAAIFVAPLDVVVFCLGLLFAAILALVARKADVNQRRRDEEIGRRERGRARINRAR